MGNGDAPAERELVRPKVPRAGWSLLLGIALASLVLIAWNAARDLMDPPRVVYAEDDAHESDANEDDAYEDDAYEDDAYEDDAYEDDAYEGDAYEDDAYEDDAYEVDALEDAPLGEIALDSEGVAEEPAEVLPDGLADGESEEPTASAAPSAPAADVTDPVEPSVDPETRIARMRELIRAHTESEQQEREALDDLPTVEVTTDPLDSDIRLDDGWEDDLSEPAAPAFTISQPWDYELRLWLGLGLMLLMGGALAFVARRGGDPRYGFAALTFGVWAFGDLSTTLLMTGGPTGPLTTYVVGLHSAAMHFPMIAFGLVALTASRRAGLLVALVVGAELALTVVLEWQNRHSMGDWITLVPAATAAVPWVVAASLFARHARAPSASAAGVPGGPYRDAPAMDTVRSTHSSLRAVRWLLCAWFGAQLLTAAGAGLHLVEHVGVAAYLVAADVAVAIFATMEVFASRDAGERGLWRSTATVLWALGLLSALLLAAQYPASLGMGSGLGTEVGFGLRALAAALEGAAMGLLLRALHAAAVARLDEDEEPPIAPRPAEVAAVVLGAAAFRCAIAWPVGDGVVWLGLAGFIVVGTIALLRVTGRLPGVSPARPRRG